MAKSQKVKIDRFEKAVNDALDEYKEGGLTNFRNAIRSLTREALNRVKEAAPEKTGKYRKSLRSKYQDTFTGGKGEVYATAPHWRLTHLLENGHEVYYFGHKTGRRSREFPHWKKGQEFIEEQWKKKVEDAYTGG